MIYFLRFLKNRWQRQFKVIWIHVLIHKCVLNHNFIYFFYLFVPLIIRLKKAINQKKQSIKPNVVTASRETNLQEKNSEKYQKNKNGALVFVPLLFHVLKKQTAKTR